MTLWLNFPTLDVSVSVVASSPDESHDLRLLLADTRSSIRLPRFQWAPYAAHGTRGAVSFEMRTDPTPAYAPLPGKTLDKWIEFDESQFHWDFWSLVQSSLSNLAREKNIVGLHAACVSTDGNAVLLPGGSGAGKSTISAAAHEAGFNVLATESTFVADSTFVTGNATAEFRLSSIRQFNIELDGLSSENGTGTMPLLGSEPRLIRAVVWPSLREGNVLAREISPARARELLFRNAVEEAGFALLLGGRRKVFVSDSQPHSLQIIADEAARLSTLRHLAISGPPETVVAELALLCDQAQTRT